MITSPQQDFTTAARLASLERTLALSTLSGDHYRRILRLAQQLCHADCAWIAVLDELGDRVLESLDIPIGEPPTLCQRVIAGDGLFECNEAGCDPQLRSHPWCSEHELNWLAAYPLRNPEGHAIGILVLGTCRGQPLDIRHRLALVDLVNLLEVEMRLDFMLTTQATALRKRMLSAPHPERERGIALPEPTAIGDLLYYSYTRCRLEQRPYALALVELDPLADGSHLLHKESREELILAAGSRLLRSLRLGDLLGCWYKERLLVLLPGVDGEELYGVGDKLVRALDDSVDLRGQTLSLTASIGLVGIAHPKPRLDHDALLQQAENTLQQAVEAGRNRARVCQLSDH